MSDSFDKVKGLALAFAAKLEVDLKDTADSIRGDDGNPMEGSEKHAAENAIYLGALYAAAKLAQKNGCSYAQWVSIAACVGADMNDIMSDSDESLHQALHTMIAPILDGTQANPVFKMMAVDASTLAELLGHLGIDPKESSKEPDDDELN